MPELPPQRVVLEVPWRTLFRLLLMAAFLWCVWQLAQTILVLVVAVLLAVTLDPIVRWLEARRFARWSAATVVTVTLLVLVVGFVWMTWHSLVAQSELVVRRFGELYDELAKHLPAGWRQAASANSGQTVSAVGGYAVSLASSAASAVTILLLAFVLMFYLLVDGRRVYDWFLAFVPLRYRSRAEATLLQGREVLFGYMLGNVITSIIATVTTFVALSLLGVPAALFLALAAGLSDFVPVVGFIVSSIPAILLALAVSAKTALAVIAVYVGYNLVESYVLSPWAYGGRMRLSDFAVIMAFVVGAELAGVIGAVLALPFAALYPTVERIWLRGQLPDETVREHRELEDREAGE